MHLSRCAAGVAALLIGGCGSTPSALLQGPPAASLLTIDQLVAPDFSLDVAAHAVTAAELVAADGVALQQLRSDGFRSAAAEDFFRNVGMLNDINGPVQIHDTVEAFGSIAGAAALFADDVRQLDATTGAIALSTGALGDRAHCTQRTADVAGVSAVEITVEWQVRNLVNVLVVRGRLGGTQLNDALLLAHTQTATEQSLTASPFAGSTPAEAAAP
ncbi:MAG: hypothetical protein M3R48_08165 [Candidatus Dormibacteraeota bacterium]|nr:hypothetical protein [Candidatus Dormibacteraeota bacterium]